MNRREFIHKGCFACMALGAGVAITSLSSCSTLPIAKTVLHDEKISIDPAEFINGKKVLLIRAGKLNYDILLVKSEQDTYRALLMMCSHNEFPLSPTPNTILCSSHGSEFDFEGNAKSGPAKNKLKSFPVSQENGKIIISVKSNVG